VGRKFLGNRYFLIVSLLYSIDNMQSLDINGRSFSYILVIFPSIYVVLTIFSLSVKFRACNAKHVLEKER
jgi:hypothetical protein